MRMALAALAASLALPALAHHGWSEYDNSKALKLTGKVGRTDVGVLNVTHVAVFCVFQKQPRPDVTVIVPLPAEAVSDAVDGEML